MTFRLIILLCLFTLSSCASNGRLNDWGSTLGFISAYDASVIDYKQGRMMEARTRLLTLARDHEDYKKARSFLKRKVNPARLKLLRYYARKGKKEEKLQHWANAEEAYTTAAALSIKPKALLRYQANMTFKVRQLRVQTLFTQLKIEDEAWRKWQDAYNPPRGLSGTDIGFQSAYALYQDILDERASSIWGLARDFERQDLPEMAWVYAHAYLRLMPDAEKAQILQAEMAKLSPKGLILGGFVQKAKKRKPPTVRKPAKRKISKQQVVQLMQDAKWISARTYAHILRRQGHPDADHLLETIDHENEIRGKNAFEQGNLAFRLENIDRAVTFWQQAVKRMPMEQSYQDSLRRGKQIQERLNALKTEESQADKAIPIEE